jgi:light-regulated signal transduction histidine kinase (bacteriophytochrome)
MDKVVGVMSLASSKLVRLDEGDIDLLTTIGNQIAVASNNARFYEDLKKEVKTLHEKKEMTEFITYSVSHDLKSPAVGMYGLAKRFKEKYSNILDEKGKAYCHQILKTSEQMLALVKKINEYATRKEISLNLEKVKVKEITDTVRDEFSLILKQRHIFWAEPVTLPEIIADRLALLRVFQNFMENALKYGGEEMSEIRIGYEESEAFHILSFHDDGVGIHAADAEMIFEIFKRHETSRGTTGSGLGLAIVKEIAKTHKGKVWLDVGAKKGVTFYISISKGLNMID